MQNSNQVSIWIPILVGILGIIGVIAGQMVNVVREGRQWTREQEKEKIKLDHSDTLDWRKIRLASYSKFLAITKDGSHKLALSSLYINSREGLDEARQYASELTEKIEELAAEISLLGSPETAILVDEYEDQISSIRLELWAIGYADETSKQKIDAARDKIIRHSDDAHDLTAKIRVAFRADLGINQLE
jgi:hypothetical protein